MWIYDWIPYDSFRTKMLHVFELFLLSLLFQVFEIQAEFQLVST